MSQILRGEEVDEKRGVGGGCVGGDFKFKSVVLIEPHDPKSRIKYYGRARFLGVDGGEVKSRKTEQTAETAAALEEATKDLSVHNLIECILSE